MSDPKSEAQVVAELVKEHLDPQVLSQEEVQNASVLILPKGLDAHSVKKFADEYLAAPRRRQGTAKFQELGSFIEHAKRFSDGDSALFASDDEPSLTSVLDYHRKGFDGAPQFGNHRGVYVFPVSNEWTTWIEQSGKTFQQAEFAEFVETHILDVSDPGTAGDAAMGLAQNIGTTFASPSRLLELSRGLSVRVDSKISQAVVLATGETQFSYQDTHTDTYGSPIKIPSAFLIAIPVFTGGPLYQVAVRLRYRAKSGPVTWFFELFRSDRTFDHAFKESCSLAQMETGLPLFYGSPEWS